MPVLRRLLAAALLAPLPLVAQPASTPSAAAPVVGPARGTVIVVGGGAMGPEIYERFIAAAGGPDALIIDVPTAGGAEDYGDDAAGARGFRRAGARNVRVLHTTDRALADADSFVAVLRSAGGVWFEGGRQYRLVDAYAGTKTEQAFRDVLARGGVIGGPAAGATILGDFLVRGAPSNDNRIMDDPSHRQGFAYLRGVAIDQHVVARDRLADLADSIMPRYPQLLGISEDEGTAWVVRGDTAEIIGRNKAFVYGGADPTPAGVPLLTLYPGDRYDLGRRRVIARAADRWAGGAAFVDSLLRRYADPAAGGATVLVARDGAVLVDRSFGIPPQPRYMPTTAVPQFELGEISSVFTALCAQLEDGGGDAPARARRGPPMTPFQACLARRVSTPVGLHRTEADSAGRVRSSVDELYRLALGLDAPGTFTRGAADVDAAAGWQADSIAGARRLSAFATGDGRRGAFVRIPARRATIIILPTDPAADARTMADAIARRLLAGS